jgi:hypothetical protein
MTEEPQGNAAVAGQLERGVRPDAPKVDVLDDLKRAAAAKWRGDPAAQQWGLFARAAAEIETLRAALEAAHRMWNEQAARDALTNEQVAALTIMLDHYKGDPRTACLLPLVYGPNARGKPRRQASA